MIVLGAPNAADGTLSKVALSRLALCYEQYCQEPSMVLLTGGFGPHFNVSAFPHAHYGKQYLLAQGVPETAFLPFAESANTVQDALLAKAILEQHTPWQALVITSDFHLARARYIFTQVFPAASRFAFRGASSQAIAAEELQRYQAHEAKALQDLYTNGVRY